MALGWLVTRIGSRVLLAEAPWDGMAPGVARSLGIALRDARRPAHPTSGDAGIRLCHPPRVAGPTAGHVAVIPGPDSDDLLWYQASGLADEALLAVRFPAPAYGAVGRRRTCSTRDGLTPPSRTICR